MAMTSPVNDGTAGATAARDRKITREIVLATALELIDRDGADALSMRRLAHALDRDPMILYRHAASKAALIDGIAETVLAQLHVDPADPDWNAQLRTVARGYRALALAHPHVVPLLVTRPLATPLGLRPRGTLRPLEDILALLTRAGFSGPDALHIYRALFVFLHGHILNELQELVENPDETDDLLRLGLHRLPIKEFPLLRSLGPALARYDGTAELERGLSILLAGLTTTLTPHTTPPPIPAQTTGHPQEDPPLSSPDTPHKVEIKDGDQTAAAAEMTTSQETGGTAQAALHAASGHIAPGSRATLVDAVMNLPEVQASAHLEATVQLGDTESLDRLRDRTDDTAIRPAGSTALIDANIPPGGEPEPSQSPDDPTP